MRNEQQEAKAIACDFFARFDAGDIRGAVDLLDEDATWRLPGKPDRMPASGNYTKEGIHRLFSQMMSRLRNGLAMSVTSAIAEGDTVALEVVSHGVLDDGTAYDNSYHFLMRMVNGKIREVHEYNDTLHAHEVWFRSTEQRPA